MEKNTYITYDKLLSLVNDYFRMTWWEDFLSEWTLEMIINLSIQDILNHSWYTHLSEFEVITPNEEIYKENYRIFETKFPINILHEVLINWTWESLWVVNRLPYLWSQEIYYRKWTNKIYVPNLDWLEHLTVNYDRAYEYQPLWNNEHRDKIIPVPFTHVPALIKMIYDNSSIFTFFQWDGVNTDFFSHSLSRINKIIEQDKLSTKEKIIVP